MDYIFTSQRAIYLSLLFCSPFEIDEVNLNILVVVVVCCCCVTVTTAKGSPVQYNTAILLFSMLSGFVFHFVLR